MTLREFTLPFRVRYAETDQMGFVHHANYLIYFEMARIEMLRADPRLNAAAAQHAAWMAAHRSLSHTGPGGSTAVTRAAAQGYTGRSYAIAENIAYGQRTTTEVFNAWVASAGHRHNIDNAVYQDVGIGVATAADGARYWAVTFGKIVP